MSCSSGQLPKHAKSSNRKMRASVKRSTAKLARRIGKVNLDSAPARRMFGYAD